jgi:endoglucanase
MKELVRELTEAYGPSGHEEQVRDIIRRHVEGSADRVEVDALGNLIAVRGPEGGRRMMLAAHMDEIGVVVTRIDEGGFLRFAPVGLHDAAILLGTRVRFADGQVGTVSHERRERGEKPELNRMYVDVGATSREDAGVAVGDVACFDARFVQRGSRIMAKALDDRIGCAILIQVLQDMGETPHRVHFVFTAQEEVGLRGATTSAYAVDPGLGVVVDLTEAGDTPKSHGTAAELGKGPAIKIMEKGTLTDPRANALLERCAQEAGVPVQRQVARWGGSDASAIQVTRSGVPVALPCIPARYEHTPSEMIDIRDAEGCEAILRRLVMSSLDLD